MSRFYEWLKIVFTEKVNLFIKGGFGGWLFSGILLFDSTPTGSVIVVILTILLKIAVMCLSGFFSGLCTVLGNDFAKWLKAKWGKPQDGE
jgi:hypothetical protein